MWGALKIDLEKFFSKVKKRLYHENVILIEKAGDILKISTKINKKWVLIVKSRSLKVHSEIWKVPHIFKKPNLNQKVCDLNRDLRGIFGGVLFYFQLRSRFLSPTFMIELFKIRQLLIYRRYFSFSRLFFYQDQATSFYQDFADPFQRSRFYRDFFLFRAHFSRSGNTFYKINKSSSSRQQLSFFYSKSNPTPFYKISTHSYSY